MTPSENLLLLLNKSHRTTSEDAQIFAILGQVQLPELMSLAQGNAVTLRTLEQLEKLNAKMEIPFLNELQACWSEQIEKLRAHNQNRETWTKKFLQRCHDEKIDLVLLKGSCLGPLIYGQFSYKKMNDIDVLIRREDGPRISQILTELSFQSVGDLFHLDEFSESNHHSPPYYSPDGQCLIGLHWQLCAPYAKWRPHFDLIWKTRAPVTVLGVSAFRLKWEIMLLHLCFHLPFFKIGLRELADVANLLLEKNAEIDWTEVQNLMRDWKCSDPVFRVLSLTNTLYPGLIPNSILRASRKSAIAWTLQDTDARSQNISLLLRSRSTYIAKIEKAYTLSRVSKSYRERFICWAATWKMSFFPPPTELLKLVGKFDFSSPLSLAKARLQAPWLCIKAMSRDYGILPFVVITVINVGNGITSGLMSLIIAGETPIMKSKNYEILKALE